MLRQPHQIVSIALAGLYAAVALFGHGLHTHGGCDGCESAACVGGEALTPAPSACACGHSHDAPARSSTPAPADPRFAETGHDATNCLACSLLAKLRQGHSPAATPTLAQPALASQPLSQAFFFAPPAQRLADARGPPAASV